MHGLLIRKEPLDKILARRKTWEIRGSATRMRRLIGLIQSGSGTVVGTCQLTNVIGPLATRDLKANASKLGLRPEAIKSKPYKRTYAWVLRSARRLPRPVRYAHPVGAVIWVKLSDLVSQRIGLAETGATRASGHA